MTRTCSDCPAPITRQSKTGRCRQCSLAHINASSEIRARQRSAVRAYALQPEVRRACAARLAAHAANMSDEERIRRREQGQHIAATVLQTDRVRALSNSPAAKAKAGAARTNTVLAWCPPAYRDQYRTLTVSQRLPAAEARRLIEEQIATDRARMTPFERDMARLAAGAQLVSAPDFRTAGPAFTLGGIASGML